MIDIYLPLGEKERKEKKKKKKKLWGLPVWKLDSHTDETILEGVVTNSVNL